jgi:hypothetical protein
LSPNGVLEQDDDLKKVILLGKLGNAVFPKTAPIGTAFERIAALRYR